MFDTIVQNIKSFIFLYLPVKNIAYALLLIVSMPTCAKSNQDILQSYSVLRMTVGNINCTASIIGPYTLLTAAHCLHNKKNQSFYNPHAISFSAPNIDMAEQLRVTGYTVGSKSFGKRINELALNADWAILTVNAPIGCHVKPLVITPASNDMSGNIFITGYPLNNKSVRKSEYCQWALPPKDGRTLRLKQCKLEHGDSGAPVLIDRDNQLQLIGIVSAGVLDSHQRYRLLATPTSSFTAKINLKTCPK